MNIKYNVDREKRVVAAYFDKDPLDMMEKLVGKTFRPFNTSWDKAISVEGWLIEKRIKAKVRGYEMVGIAKCAPEDKFDDEIGKKLAKERLLWRWRACKRDVAEFYKKRMLTTCKEVNTAFDNMAKR